MINTFHVSLRGSKVLTVLVLLIQHIQKVQIQNILDTQRKLLDENLSKKITLTIYNLIWHNGNIPNPKGGNKKLKINETKARTKPSRTNIESSGSISQGFMPRMIYGKR